jgi:hypothetical protein
MLISVKEVYVGKESDPRDDLLFWTYMICSVHSGRAKRYNLIRIDNVCEKMERLGCELTFAHCRQLIKSHEPSYIVGKIYVRQKT